MYDRLEVPVVETKLVTGRTDVPDEVPEPEAVGKPEEPEVALGARYGPYARLTTVVGVGLH